MTETPELPWHALDLATEARRHERARALISRLSPELFALKVRRVRGQPFSFGGHEYLRDLYADQHPHVVIEKAAQMGASELAISRALYTCVTRDGVCVILFFPTDQDVRDFSRHRVAPALEDLRQAGLLDDTGARKTDNVGLREVGRSVLYFRGMQSGIRMKSVPADFLIFDELDESPPEFKPLARERLSHSDMKWILELSTPTLPDYGIDVEFRRSDQRYWHVECGCPDGVVLELTFPECLARRRGGAVELRCPRCGRGPLDPSAGRWIAHAPERAERRGYHLSQLFSTAISPREILEEYETTRNVAEFHNSKLGIPYAGDRMPLTRAELLRAMGEHERGAAGGGLRVMGVDQGKILHWLLLEIAERETRIVDLGVVDGFPEIARRIEREGVALCVIDGLPNQHSARDLARSLPGRVALCYYAEAHRGEPDLRPGRDTVVVDRTEALDRVVTDLLRGLVALPDRLDADVEELIRHLTAIAKVEKEDERTGERTARYLRTGPDHYAHALGYDLIAADRARRVPVVTARAGRAR